MKFVLFNIAVVAALFVLFNPDRADFRALADRASESVGVARGAVEKAIAGEKQAAKADVGNVKPAPVKAAADRKVFEEKVEEAPVAPAPAPRVAPTPKPAIKPVRVAAQEPGPTPQPAAEPTLDPAVAKRRAEVLGLAPPTSNEALPPATDKLMSAEERRRELFSLAEEMELFYVKRLSR